MSTRPDRRASFRFLLPTDPGFDRAFGVIARRFGDSTCLDTQTGEVWQYMGTCTTPDGPVHEFRHRWLPAAQQRTYYQVPVEPGDFQEPRP